MLRIILLIGVLVVSANAGGDLDRQWKARGLQGLEKADSLSKLLPKTSTKNKPTKAWLEFAMEMAYAAFINPDLKNVVKKRTSTVLAFHFIMKIGEMEESNLLDIAYLYDPKSEVFLGIRVDRLPYPWCLRPDFDEKYPGIFSINNVNDTSVPAILFNKKDPFDTMVLPL
ncbi:MAG: hypothetical protein ABI036_14185 [Fibrobacteria bacterium]